MVYFLLLSMKESMGHAVTAKRYYGWNCLVVNAFGSALYNVYVKRISAIFLSQSYYRAMSSCTVVIFYLFSFSH